MHKRLESDLACLLAPRSVAVLGASQARGKHGNTALRYLMGSGYSGAVHVVNPNAQTVEGLRAVASVDLLPSGIECAFLAIPAEGVVKAISDCARQGVRAAVIAASGFAETGTEEGRERQRAVAEIARRAGMRILGPNTNGFINNSQGVVLGYNTSHGEDLRKGSIAIVSQSGAVLNTIARSLAEHTAGLSHFVTVGNEADVTLEDVLAHFIEDPHSTVIGLIVESISGVERFTALARAAREAGKPIVALKLGRSQAGAAAALAHSSRMAGQPRAYDAVFAACDIRPVQTIEAFAAALAIHEKHPVRASAGVETRLICVATSGGGAALTVDAAADAGLRLAGPQHVDWAAAVRATAAHVQNGLLQNPLDLSALGSSWEPLSNVFPEMERCGFTGPVVAFSHIAARPQQDDRLFNALAGRRSRTTTPVCVLSPGGLRPEIEERYRSSDIFVFHHTTTLMAALSAWCQTAGAPASASRAPAHEAQGPGEPGQRMLSEIESAEALRQAGVPIVEGLIVEDRAALARVGEALSFPLVLKGILPGVAHKAAQGLVRLGIMNETDLTKAYEDLAAIARDVPGGSYRALAQPQLRGDLELILGVSDEGGLGHFLLIGLGGIYAEAMDLSVMMPLGAAVEIKRAVLQKSRMGGLLAGLKGYSFDALSEDLIQIGERLRQFVSTRDGAVVSIDLNPVLVRPEGCVAVDALVVLKGA